eukprot:NODE_18579_length_886_cov_2.558630.p2 GENE.NODE_18579_length_886_cov_2.558630~~NODE_18579_length_886_cov_2.558630.p2  ORF type:complete len:90 (-),score=54.05 NODE_18579_length_886_cov_2.558630:73-342(-)
MPERGVWPLPERTCSGRCELDMGGVVGFALCVVCCVWAAMDGTISNFIANEPNQKKKKKKKKKKNLSLKKKKQKHKKKNKKKINKKKKK